MIQFFRDPCSDNTGEVAFFNENGKTKDLTGTATLIVSGKYG